VFDVWVLLFLILISDSYSFHPERGHASGVPGYMAESRDPENVSRPMPLQGVLPKALLALRAPVQPYYHFPMLRTPSLLLFLLLLLCAFCQSEAQIPTKCDSDITHRGRVWSPDCRSYFENGNTYWPRLRSPFLIEVYTLRDGRTYLSDPTEDVTCNLAVEALACGPIEFHHTEWVGSDRLRLHVHMLCGRARTVRNLTYVVDAQTGGILESSKPSRRNWKCRPWSQEAFGGMVTGDIKK
jgi:hypothetical protein